VVKFTAVNIATTGIHVDEVARSYGSPGGLVPGSSMFSYACETLRTEFGQQWLEDGWISVRYGAPLYDDEVLDVALTYDHAPGVRGQLAGTNPRGGACVSGTFGRGANGHSRWLGSELPLTALPPSPVDMTSAALIEAEFLGSIEMRIEGSEMVDYLTRIGVGPDDYLAAGIAHPGFVLRSCSGELRRRNFARSGPGIDAGSEMHMARSVRLGEVLSVRGRVERLFRRSGRSYATFEVGLHDAAGAAVVRGLRTSIFEIDALRAAGVGS
jgi:hypothetical protein